jgi:hypothetical protein
VGKPRVLQPSSCGTRKLKASAAPRLLLAALSSVLDASSFRHLASNGYVVVLSGHDDSIYLSCIS